jgi:hypothetical protein
VPPDALNDGVLDISIFHPDKVLERSFRSLREQVGAGLREHQISAGRVHREPAVRDRGFHGHAVQRIRQSKDRRQRLQIADGVPRDLEQVADAFWFVVIE